MGLPEEIAMIRKKGLCTQIEFAKHVGVSYSTVNRWETGKMSPNVSAMKKIKSYCDAFNIEFDSVEKAWLEKSSDSQTADKKE